jgi:AcrR family transcriptional regulator
MPRPSLKEARTIELLDAFERCVARFGLDGSTLEKISEEASVGRPLLRHYLGNREQMVSALLDHILAKFSYLNQCLVSELPNEGRFETILDRLFDKDYHEMEQAAVFQALVAASERHDGMAKKLMQFVHELEEILTAELKASKPQAALEDCKTAVSGITSIYFSLDALTPLNPDPTWRARQLQAVDWLLGRLDS